MRGDMKRLLAFLALGLTFLATTASPVTVEEILRLKKAGVSDETIQRYIELEKLRLRGPGRFMGRKTVVGPDGKKRVIIYSIEDPAKAMIPPLQNPIFRSSSVASRCSRMADRWPSLSRRRP